MSSVRIVEFPNCHFPKLEVSNFGFQMFHFFNSECSNVRSYVVRIPKCSFEVHMSGDPFYYNLILLYVSICLNLVFSIFEVRNYEAWISVVDCSCFKLGIVKM